MSHSRKFIWTAALVLLSAIVPGPSLADTIILKNGRRIVAEGVREEGGWVLYEGELGRISIPKSLVERIEKGGAVPPRRPSAPTVGVTQNRMTGEISAQLRLPAVNTEAILRNGAVDEERLAELQRQANQGDSERQNAVNAHLLAAVHEARQQRLAAASRWAESALGISSQDLNALMLAAQIDLGRRQYSEALDHLLLANSLQPNSPDVLTLLGYAYYFSEGAERAVWYWRQADLQRPDPRLQEQIRLAEREAQVESGLEQAESYHFALGWEGSEVPGSFGREILEAMEGQYKELEVSLDFSPREPITVVLYPSQQFQDITRAPGWAGAVNDGKIRVPVQGLTSMTADLAQVLKHEMAHSFVHQMVEGRCPTWLNEGLAQLESGEDLSFFGPELMRRRVPLAQLEGSFRRFNPSQAGLAYAESLAAVEMIREQYGAYQLPLLLKTLREGRTMEQALESVLRMSYADLEEALGLYLAQRYGR